jgi:hypothetical protein
MKQGSVDQCNEMPAQEAVDFRESLVNDRLSGIISDVSIPQDMITTLHGIMLDFDPDLYDPALLPADAGQSPLAFYERLLKPILEHHPVYGAAEVRDTGRGLHAIIWLDPPVVFKSEGDRQRWSSAVKVLQKVVPSDPHAPGITAMTRPVGSLNGKTGRQVTVLKKGHPVPQSDVLKLVEGIRAAPFEMVAKILFGERTSPCPVCRKTGTRLGVFKTNGLCYGGCGKVPPSSLLDVFFAQKTSVKEI